MKRSFTISGLVLFFFLFISSAFAQNVAVRGKVTDASTGETLIGVSVLVKGTSNGAQTDVNGGYSINAPSNATLVFSYIGYTSQEVPVNGQLLINVKLQGQANSLNEVVVVGYGTQKKVDVTGSIATVKGDEIAKQASTNPLSALQGKVAGLNIVNSGSPGSSPQITIRGTGTIYGGTGLLYVVDGALYDDINFLNPGDIDNISILKDASSTAIYGERAANGVILVTTKRGKKGTATVNYNAYAGWQHVTNQVKMADATEYATAINELQTENGASALFTDPASFGKGTDWYGQILRDAFVTNHQVSINGGAEKSDYNLSFGYLDQDGIVKTNSYNRYTLHLTDNYQPYKNLKLGISASGQYSKSRNVDGGIFHELYGAAPVVPVYYADGTYGDPSDFNLGGGNNYNPQVTLDYFNSHSANYRFTGNAFAELTIAKHFKLKSSLGGDFGENETLSYVPVYKATLSQQATQSSLSRSRAETRNWLQENTLTYDNTFANDHHVTVLLGYSSEQRQGYSLNGSAQNVPGDGSYEYYFSTNGTNFNLSDSGSLLTFQSEFARVNYSYKDTYLLNASVRRDGNSQFYNPPSNNGYSVLPAVGLGWVISNEDFMKNQHIFNFLKLRGGYGEVANADLPFNVAVPTVTGGYYAIFGNPTVAYPGSSVTTITPPFIVVERSHNTDIGLEGGLLDNHLTFEADFYNRVTKNAVFAIPVLGSLGLTGGPIGNQADIQNRGFEFLVTWKKSVNKDFSYSVSGNFSINNNKVLNVSTGRNPIYGGGNGITNGALATITVEGQPIGEFYGYKVAGIFQQDQTSGPQPNAKAGDFQYVDENKDGVIDGRDRVNLGNPNPKYNYGFNTSFTYKGFDLALDFQGVAGVSIYNANIAYRFGNENFTQDFYAHRWHGAGTSNTYPSVKVGSNANSAPNSFFVESGAYFRVRNAQLGYTLPGNLLSKVGVQKVRFFANAQNPLNIFKYKGFSPEVGGGPTEAGLDANVYPLYATYNFGVNVTF
ncbi:TonB-dependent receptor [Mucilaginibacter sp.]|jgi:TonB-linked SusC/RagA family outer membrane protein|uniref:SusC/RagA family TonB-linked outer membrane protein n=1 Tax=Mucilaginibacter sp. TaxID=1882438 RepID=UPI002C8361F8|nr:TonB-dependent receptor [Mucilaginibacter sp.]HTI59170.1 TonB-dependent receptor [Mucilaginibacter sp.]